MADTIASLKAMKIGCDNVVWAPLEADAASGVTYKVDGGGKPLIYQLPGVMSLNINPNMSIETAYYDDGPGEVATALGNIEVTLNKSALGLKEAAMLLGATYIKTAVKDSGDMHLLLAGVADTPAWGAIGFRTLKADGTYRYVWLYKGKFSIPASNNETKADSINFQSDEISGRFVSTKGGFKLDSIPVWGGTPKAGKIIYPWKAEWDETSEKSQATRATIKSKWFEQVILPTFDATKA